MNPELTNGSRLKVLIVDDNEQARGMIRRCLSGRADEFCECSDGSEVLSAYADFLPDWVLMDWEMKEVNGLTATRNLLARYPAAKVLLVTNYDERDLRQAAMEAGAVAFVLKDDLRQILEILP